MRNERAEEGRGGLFRARFGCETGNRTGVRCGYRQGLVTGTHRPQGRYGHETETAKSSNPRPLRERFAILLGKRTRVRFRVPPPSKTRCHDYDSDSPRVRIQYSTDPVERIPAMATIVKTPAGTWVDLPITSGQAWVFYFVPVRRPDPKRWIIPQKVIAQASSAR